MRLTKVAVWAISAVFFSVITNAMAEAGPNSGGTDTAQTVGDGGTATGSAVTSNRVLIRPASASGTSAVSGFRTITLTMPAGTETETLKVVLNGKDVTSRFSPSACAGAVCESGTLSSADGLRDAKNVLYAIAKNQSGSAVSSRLRFDGSEAQPTGRAITPMARAMAQSPSAQGLPTASSFLPPTISLSTLNAFGGVAGSAWLQLGTQVQLNAPANCSSGYDVIVLDRQTLVQKQTSPQCFADGQSLKGYLKGLTSSELVIVGTAYLSRSDAYLAAGQLDTTAIGGTAYNCIAAVFPGLNGCKPLAGTPTATSNDVPYSYIAIGAGGAAPGSAYENYHTGSESSTAPNDDYFFSNAHGMLTEDANGNYNFQSAWAVEYVVSPGTQASNASLTLNNPPLFAGQKVVYTPPTGSNGIWVLLLNRGSLESVDQGTGSCQASSNAPGGETDWVNCGTFYPMGSTDADTRVAALQALGAQLNNLDRRDLVVLTTVGTADQGSIWDLANNNTGSSYDGGWSDKGRLTLAAAFHNLGLPDNTTLSLGTPNSTFTYIGGLGLGNALSGHAVLSSSLYANQGQSGYVHGTMTRDLQGLYRPGHTEQQAAGADYSNFTLGLVTSYTPVDWPELTTSLPGADSVAGQQNAYAYLSWYLLNAWYAKGQEATPGISGPYAYDMHYFFTGSLNTYIDYHTFDPEDAVWPGTPGFANGNPFNVSCPVTGTTCTWTNPFDNTVLTFTQNDFNAVKSQVHNEVVDLTNVLLYMVNGSTNMKNIVAAGNSNTALALLGAASEVSASINQPQIQQEPVTVSPWNIVSMIGGGLTTLAGLDTFGAADLAATGIEDLNATVDLVADLFSDAAGAAGGFTTGGGTTSSGLPSPDYILSTTVGQLANTDLQGQVLAGFDTTLDTITGDWGKLNIIGPQITDPTNKTFFAPNQVLQNASISMMKQASKRSLYLSLIPALFQVQYWPQVNSATMSSPNYPDMGYTSNGDNGSCHAFYNPNTPPPTNVSAWYPSYGGKTYTQWWNQGQQGYPFQYDWSVNPVDFYVIAQPFSTSANTSDETVNYPDQQLAATLFGNQPGQLNFSLDAFVAKSGPMDWPLGGAPSSWVDASYEYPPDGVKNITGHENGNMCSMAYVNPAGVGSGAPSTSMTNTTLMAPASAVLGESVTLQATVVPTTGTGSAPSGNVQFRDGSTVLTTATLDATGSATFSTSQLHVGVHSLSAYYISSGSYEASNSAASTMTIYANAPDVSLSLSATSLSVSYGTTSSAITVQAKSRAGLAGAVNFSCSGLPIGMSCNFSPAQLSMTAGSSTTTTLTITSAKTGTAGVSSARGFGLLLLSLSVLCLGRMRKAGRGLPGLMSMLGLSALLLGGILGCSSGNSPSTQETGSKTILITASTSSFTRTIPLVINIQ